MSFLWGCLSMAICVTAMLSGMMACLAIVARDLSFRLTHKQRWLMIGLAAVGYILSCGGCFALDARLRIPLVSYAYVWTVGFTSLTIVAAVIRWFFTINLKLSASDLDQMHTARYR